MVLDRSTQDTLGVKGAVEALLTAILRLQETAAHTCRRSIADAVQALHYICLMNNNNVARLASNQGLNIIRLCEWSEADSPMDWLLMLPSWLAGLLGLSAKHASMAGQW